MIKIIKEESTISYVEERDWFLGDLKLRETILKEEELTHYNNGLITKDENTYYIRMNNGKICSGQISQNGIVREISIQKCIDVMNKVDWNKEVI